MIPHKNTVKHDPANGTYGDCHRCCVATILGMEPSEVPHFYENPEVDGQGLIEEFLDRFMLRDVPVYFAADTGLEQVLTLSREMYKDTPAILGGTSRTGCNHSVVIMNGEIVSDPTDAGIIGPLDNGFYCLSFITVAPNFVKWLRRRPVV